MPVLVGTSGWQYASWRGRLYPAGLPQARWLEHYAARFQIVEVNNTFYHLPRAETFDAWRQRTPADFVVAPKVSRYVTHIRRLRDPHDSIALFLERCTRLGAKTGPLLLQLPPTMEADPARLDAALACIPAHLRVAVEPRHASWWTDAVRDVLTAHNAALCLADRDSRPVTPLWRTAGWAYLRFHSGTGSPWPCYGRDALASWARRLADMWGDGGDCYVFFNNDPNGCAVRDAVRFAHACTAAGLTPSRVPDESETPVG